MTTRRELIGDKATAEVVAFWGRWYCSGKQYIDHFTKDVKLTPAEGAFVRWVVACNGGEYAPTSLRDYLDNPLAAGECVLLDSLNQLDEQCVPDRQEDALPPIGDPTNPNHYRQGKVECIDAIESATTGLTGAEAYCTGNAIKYLWRWKRKNGAEDLRKARWYLDKLIALADNATAIDKTQTGD